MNSLASAHIVLGVSGGIAAYKAADLASKLVQAEATVDVILTSGALEFIRPLTFQAITKRPVHTSVFDGWSETSYGHITLARDASLLVVAPASANTITHLALGLADDMLTAVALSTEAPLIVAPAMEHGMLRHPATQGHLATLRDRGALQVGPDTGRLASGYHGDGRLVPIERVVGAIRYALGRKGPLAGRRLVVTAGGTHEPLDPVRFIGNRSSGTMGFALAQSAIDLGANVSLVAGPGSLAPPYGVDLVRVESAEEMAAAVQRQVADADVLVMAAAVADFRPAAAAEQKIKKQPGQESMTIELVRNPDIVASVNRRGLIKIGFAAETEDLTVNARAKLESKGLAMIVANDAVATIGSADSTATIIQPGAAPETLPPMAKSTLASEIISRVATLLDARERMGHA